MRKLRLKVIQSNQAINRWFYILTNVSFLLNLRSPCLPLPYVPSSEQLLGVWAELMKRVKGLDSLLIWALFLFFTLRLPRDTAAWFKTQKCTLKKHNTRPQRWQHIVKTEQQSGHFHPFCFTCVIYQKRGKVWQKTKNSAALAKVVQIVIIHFLQWSCIATPSRAQ